MKIYFNGNIDLLKEEIKKILGNVKISYDNGFISVDRFKHGEIYNKLPQIENISSVKKIIIENRELCPLAYKKNYYFKSPLNTYRKFIIAGPCVITDFEEFKKDAVILSETGADAIRAPIFKPRSSPYGWEGFGESGIKRLREIKKIIKKTFVGEVLDPRLIDKVESIFDIIQIGARNMKNYVLLKEAGISKKPVLLKRQPGSSLREVLYSVEYLLKYGTDKIIICERGDNLSDGIPSINTEIIKKIKKEIKIPVISDISHSAKNRKFVEIFARKTKNISDGFMVEVSSRPELSPIDTKQIISIDDFKNIIRFIKW